LMYNDKKNSTEEISCVLLEGIGKASYLNTISEKIALDALNYMESVYQSN
jgi:3-dehydroquinate synthetase